MTHALGFAYNTWGASQAQADLEEPENGFLLKVGTHVPLPLKEALEAAGTLRFVQSMGEGVLP